MIIGPDNVFQCHHCHKKTLHLSVTSCNTFGAIYFSDGSVSGPMNCMVSPVVKCPACHNLFWTVDIQPVRKYPVLDERPEKNNIPRAETPTEADLFYAIKEHLYHDHEQLLYLRMQIWRMGNKKKMSNAEMFNAEDEASRWRENAEALVELLDQETTDNKLMLAELHRNLGDFDGCRNILKTIKDNDYVPVVNRLNEECDKLNKCRVQL